MLSGPALITNNVVTFTGLGKVVLAADQSGDGYFNPAPEVTTSFKVIKGNQTISPFPPLGFSSISKNALPFTIVPPSSNSGLLVTVSVKSGPAKIKNNLVTLTKKAGSKVVVLAANQKGDIDYNRASEVTQTFSVTP